MKMLDVKLNKAEGLMVYIVGWCALDMVYCYACNRPFNMEASMLTATAVFTIRTIYEACKADNRYNRLQEDK